MNTNLINDNVKDFIFMFLCGIENVYNAINLRQFNSKAELYEVTLKAIENKLNFEIAIKKINIIYEEFKINNQLNLNIPPKEQLKNNLEQIGLPTF